LEPRARATTTRRGLSIGKTDRPVVELVDDAVEVTEAPGGASRFRQIEIEVLRDEGAGGARDGAKKLRAAGAPQAPGGPANAARTGPRAPRRRRAVRRSTAPSPGIPTRGPRSRRSGRDRRSTSWSGPRSPS